MSNKLKFLTRYMFVVVLTNKLTFPNKFVCLHDFSCKSKTADEILILKHFI